MTLQIHPKDREAFMELQTKMIDTNRLLNQVNMKIQIADREKRRAQLTLKEVDSLPNSDTRTFKSVGKMFLLTPVEDLRAELKEVAVKYDADLQNLANQQKYLDNTLKDCEKSIKELIVKSS